MMTNAQAQAYAVIALNRMIEDGELKANDSKKALYLLTGYMLHAFDVFTEEGAETKARKILA